MYFETFHGFFTPDAQVEYMQPGVIRTIDHVTVLIKPRRSLEILEKCMSFLPISVTKLVLVLSKFKQTDKSRAHLIPTINCFQLFLLGPMSMQMKNTRVYRSETDGMSVKLDIM